MIIAIWKCPDVPETKPNKYSRIFFEKKLNNQNMGSDLLHELFNNPAQFVKNKYKGYNLLNEYLGGLDIETLRPALQSDNSDINNIAVSIISELNEASCAYLLPYLLTLIDMPDSVYTQYLLTGIFKGTLKVNCKDFAPVILQLNSQDYRRVISAMDLISRANKCQLEHSFAHLQQTGQAPVLIKGLEMLLNIQCLHRDQIVQMISDRDPVLQYFGGIIACKLQKTDPELLDSAYHSSNDILSKFTAMSIDV